MFCIPRKSRRSRHPALHIVCVPGHALSPPFHYMLSITPPCLSRTCLAPTFNAYHWHAVPSPAYCSTYCKDALDRAPPLSPASHLVPLIPSIPPLNYDVPDIVPTHPNHVNPVRRYLLSFIPLPSIHFTVTEILYYIPHAGQGFKYTYTDRHIISEHII